VTDAEAAPFKNFKAWPDSGEIRLAPLTVLFGPNSAGKTSIPQLLLMLKQTAASPDRQRALQLGDSRSLVEPAVSPSTSCARRRSPRSITRRWVRD
jgi:hypothetical protein